MSRDPLKHEYPAALIEWAGHHSGGVRRLFDDGSGRPSKAVVKTNLLARLERWANEFAASKPGTPRIVLLVGGPGNGKTEAVESTIHWLDTARGANGRIVKALTDAFSPTAGHVPRIVSVSVADPGSSAAQSTLRIVQDASAVDPGRAGRSGAQLLIEELADAVQYPDRHAYLCCVNRGVLDDALIHAIEFQMVEAKLLLEAITRSVSLSPDAPSCWPLEGFPEVATWPMDAESLLVPTDSGAQSPASILLDHSTDASRWPASGTCPAGTKCPFCTSRSLLSSEPHRSSLLQILRWYELGSGKRWSFRDLFSLISYLLAGNNTSGAEATAGPCGWAARLVDLDARNTGPRPDKERSTAIFRLVAASYQHALFGRWDPRVARQLRIDTKELGLENDHVLNGLHGFLRNDRSAIIPATIAPLLEGLVDLLDPALADPDAEVWVSARTSLLLRDIDARFSQSVGEGLSFIRKYHCLSTLEVDLLERIARLDVDLTASEVRRRRPAAANRIQRLVRDFACRLVRRSLGARDAVVRDANILRDFQSVVDDSDSSGDLLFEAAKHVEGLLNKGERFEVSLSTTFGQPLPPQSRRATLIVPKQRVRIRNANPGGRPKAPICFLCVGSMATEQPIALTYELFRAVKELAAGMSQASLPRPVVALLDTTRARLSGPLVRDEEILEDSEIRLGTSGELISRSRHRFVVRQETRK